VDFNLISSKELEQACSEFIVGIREKDKTDDDRNEIFSYIEKWIERSKKISFV
jgi:hypothetical protein